MKPILIVNDDAEIVSLLKEYLETRATANQYVVKTAADGREGLKAVSRDGGAPGDSSPGRDQGLFLRGSERSRPRRGSER
ncbi:MAG: hypothetical protein AUH29_10360 [Candidatus Rokubacteria bacterium 13_1_40CM_69_27]|nr:MAG: hypothetical protein AUH29_10360 [Candidatus Rokubacteria bacterium 13_1_40CM_69_27]OLC34470.1 MAG: hypothetical protein AUH81_12220 [Candidatus Rokubacteria bacterium 13_1_40CM_4_69_5]OLE37611.1 MAG: hypothetical protein AUG00_07670 [Candidatus Rokubacteria bacterium 13_1_20CM_2_70_7]